MSGQVFLNCPILSNEMAIRTYKKKKNNTVISIIIRITVTILDEHWRTPKPELKEISCRLVSNHTAQNPSKQPSKRSQAFASQL